MTTPTTTLADQIAAKLDALEAAALAATPGPWEVGDWWYIQSARHCRCDTGPLVWEGVRDINGTRMTAHVHRHTEPIGNDIVQADASDGCPAHVSYGSDFGPDMEDADATHIALNDPAATLARVAADRKILALHRPNEDRPAECNECGAGDDGRYPEDTYWFPTAWPCPTIRALASQWPDVAEGES